MEAERMAKKDIISSLPSSVIEIILCRVSIRDAVRTSILSRDWRYKWATIPKLVFNENDMFDKSKKKHNPGKPPNGKKQVFYAINQVLLLHESPIHEFTLSMNAYKTYIEIDPILLHLSRRNTIKKLALDFDNETYNKLPLCVLSFHQLTDLSLFWCDFDFSPTFNGFGSLRSLSLFHVFMLEETFVHLLSSCPLLECLSLEFWLSGDTDLTLDLNKLIRCLRVSVIKHLTISAWSIKCIDTGELPTTLVHLKSLCITEMLFSYKVRLHSLFLLIRSSPNLEKIKLQQQGAANCFDDEVNSLDDYSDIWLEHLTEVEIEDFEMLKLDYEFLKLILAKSPVLEKLTIVLSNWLITTDAEEVKILRILLYFPRVSPVAKIVIKHR